MAADRSAQSLDLEKESVEVLALGAVIISQSRLHQTPEAKSVVHPHHAATVRALVMVVRGCWKGVSKAGKIHFSLSSWLLVAECAPFLRYFKAIRRPEAVSLVMID
jgi:hypothetical protein